MNDKQELERIVGLVNQWREATKNVKRLETCVKYPPSFLEDVIASSVAWQGLSVDDNPLDFPFVSYPLYSGKGLNN